MDTIAQPVSPAVVRLIEQTIAEAMDGYGLRTVEIRAAENHAGDPALFIDAHYDLTDRPVDFTRTAMSRALLWERLLAQGERRFPHIRHRFDDRQPLQPMRGRRR